MKAFIGFAGFGGVDIALREFGYQTIGVELDPDIAQVNRDNGGDIITDDLLALDPASFTDCELHHFSPPCPNFSIAKFGSSEQESDLALARKICEFIRVGQPKFFTLENVWMYRKSQSWLSISDALQEQGYGVDFWHLNAADYGVPQTRRRMVAIGRRDGHRPAKPWATHSKYPNMFTKPWVGWYEAIEDLIPDLPETQFAPWQLKRLPDELRTMLLATNEADKKVISTKLSSEPSHTITAQSGGKTRALLMPGETRSFLIGQGNRSQAKKPHQSSDTITANRNQLGIRAVIIRDQRQSKSTVQNRTDKQSVFTAAASIGDVRVAIDTRVVSITPRCLARFQDFPDWFALPDNNTLATRGIGNAMPPGVYKAVLREIGEI